ncbi:MAG: hypothetical protein ABIF28_15905 [Pseudomonadota bacterium]
MHSGDSFVNAGMIRGIGSLNLGSNTLTNTGTLFADGGLLSLTGNLVLTSNSTLRLDIGGPDRVIDHGALDVNGAVTFGGTLQTDHINGYVPPSGSEAFQLIRYTSRTGNSQFATLDVPIGFGYDSFYGVGTYLLGFGNSLTGINEWISNTSGDWATATNWSLGVAPNSPDMAVVIDRVGFTPTITISSGDWTIEELISEEHLTINGGSLTTAQAYVVGNLTLNGSGRFTVSDELVLGNVTLNSASQFIANGAGQIANYVQNNGTSTFNAAGLAFDAIDIRGGTVNYNAALALPSSLLRVAGYTANLNADQGQTLIQIVSGTLNLNLASLTSDIELSGSGTLNVVNSTSASGDLTWTGGNIGGGGTLTLSGVLDVAGGTNYFGLTDTTLVHTNASGLSRIAKGGGYFYLNGTNGILRNAAGASLTIDTSAGDAGTYYSSGTGGTLHNLGTLNKTGTGTFFIYNPTHLDQAGTLNIQQGAVNVEGSTHALSGLTTLAADSALNLNGGSSIAISGAARFTGDGRVQHNNATATLGNGARIDADYVFSSGTLNIGGAAVMNGDLAWHGGIITGDATAPGTLTLNGVLSQIGSTTVYLRNGTQLVHANASGASRIANASGSGVNIDQGAIFRNTGSLTIDTPNAGGITYIDHDSGAAGRFENTGTLTKVGAGRVDFGNFGQLQLVQQGSFVIAEGLVTLGNTVTLGGTLDIAADSTLRVLGGTTTIAAGTEVTGAGALDLGGGVLNLGNGVDIAAHQIISGGTLTVATGSSATFGNTLTWTGGSINGGGTLNASGVFSQSGNTTVYLRDGTLLLHSNASGNSRIANTSSSGFNLENGAIFRNTGVLTLDVAGSGSIMYIDQDAGPAIGRFENTGTLTKTGAGRLDFGSFGAVQFDQQGTFAVARGLVTLDGTHTLSGTQQLAGGTELRVTGGTTTAIAGAVFSGAGVLSLTSGTLTFADGLDTGITLQQSGGSFAGTGNNTLSGRYEWTGGNVTGSGALTVSGVLQLSGTSSFGLAGRSMVHTNGSGSSSMFKTSGYFYIGSGASFTNATGAQLYFDTGSGNPGLWYPSGPAGTFVNQGTLTKVGSGTLNVYSPVGLQNPGTLILGQGSVIADGFNQNAGTLQLLPGTIFSTASSPLTNTGLIAGHGTLITGGTGLLNQGTVSPGGTGSIGTLSITGRYVQDAAGTLQIERGNAGTDALIISSTATLGGTLVVSELPGYISTGGTSDVVTASALSGSFSTVTLPSGYSTQAVGNRQVLSYAGAICGGVCWDGGAGSLLWTDAANWTGDLLPGTNDLVFIDLGTISVELTNGNHTIRSLNTAAGNTLVVSGGSLTVTDVATLAGDLVISGGTANFNGAAQLARLMLSSGIFGGSGTVTFTQSGSTWTGGDVSGTGRLVLAAGSTFSYGAGTRTIARRLDIEQGGRLSLDSGSLTTTGGASNAGVVNVAFGATGRYGGSATYLLDATGQFDGGGRIEFINSAQVTSSTTSSPIADNTFTVRVQDSARFTLSTPGAIANLELADSGQVIAQASLQAGSLTQTGGTLTLNAASGAGTYNWNGGTLAGSSTFSIVGGGSWTRGTLTGNLVIANGASLTLSGTGSDDVQSTSYKRFGAGSLTNFGTLNWLEGHIDVIGAGRVDNHGLIDLASDFSFGDRSTGTGTFTMVNHASGVIAKTAGTGEFAIGTLGIPGGTANYTNFTNNGRINVFSGRLRFNIGYSGASGGGTFIHNNFIEIGAGSTLEIGGALTYNGDADLGAGGVLRRLGGFTINSGADIFGNGTIDVGTSGTLTNAGALGTLEYGTLSVTGNFVQTDSGVLDLWIGGTSTGTYDQLAVSGSVTLGGTLVVTEDPDYVRGPLSLALITAGNGISGSFATIDTPVAGYTTAVDGTAFRISFGSIVCGGICWDGGAGTALWTDAANWSGDALPGLNDLVFIALDSGSSVVLNSGTHSIASLTTAASNHLTIAGGSLTLTGLSGSNNDLASMLAGDLTISGTGALVNNARLDAARFIQTGGSFSGTGDLHVATQFSQTAGTHDGSGRTVLGSALTFAPGNYTFNRDFEIDGTLNHTSGTLGVAANRTVTVNGALNWTSGSTIAGPGTLALGEDSVSTFNAHTNGGHLVLSGVTVNNAGTVNYTSAGRELLINNSTTFNNSGRFNFASDGNVSETAGFGGSFNNSGTVAKTGGTGSSGFANFARFNNLNGGIVDSGTGVILLPTDGSHDGVFNIAGSNVRFNAGTHSFAAGATIQGIANFAGATVNTAGATFSGPVNLSGGSINQNSDTTLTLNNGLNWTSGASIAGGTLNLVAGSTSTFNAHTNGGHLVLAGVTVNNAGTVNYTSAGRELLINGGTRFNNSGRFNFASDGNVSETAGFGGHFNNSGTLAKTGGTGVSSFTNFVRFNNLDGGVVDSGTGLIVLQTEGNHAGAFNIAGNGVQFSAGVHTFAAGSTIDGRAQLTGATINTSGATFSGPVFLSGGTINIGSSSTLTMTSGLNWTSGATISGGTLNLASGSSSTFNAHTNGGHLVLSGVTVNNAGTVDYISAGRQLLINDGTHFNNSGRFNFASDGNISETSGNGGSFNNSGTLAKTAGSGSSGFVNPARMVDQGGSYRGESGTLLLASLSALGGTMHIADGATIVTGDDLTSTGIIEGRGTLDLGGGTLTNRGIVRPGGNGTVGRLTLLGGFTQEATGRIDAEFAGTAAGQFDVLDIRGNTLLDGVLNVQALGSAAPVEGMQLGVVTATGSLDAGALQLSAPTGFTTRALGGVLSLGYTSCNIGICWDGGAGTQSWSDAANWTGDIVPGVNGRVNDLVFINLAGGANVVLNAIPTVTVAGLTIGNANSLTLTGGVLNAPTTVNSGGTLNLNGGNLNFGNALLNNGVLNYAGGTMNGNVFTNNGTLNVLSGSSGNLTTTRLNNNGSVIVDSGATFEFGSGGGMIFANNGSVAVDSGTLSVLAHDTDASGPGADSGAYSVDSGATLRFRDAFRDFGPGSSITGPGDVEFTAFSGGVFNVNGGYNVSGETRVSGNTLVNFNSSATFGDLLVAGNIGGSGALTVTDDLIWTAGSIGGNGRVIVVRGDTVLDGSNLALNGAVLNVGGSGLLDTGAQLALNGGSQLIVSDGASLGLGSNTRIGGTGSLVNRGTLEGTLGGGTSNVAVRLVNDGNVQASAGNLGLTGGIGGGGLFVIGDNATMELGGDLPPDIFNRIGGNGTLSFSPTSAPVINQFFATTGGTPLLFSLRSGVVLSSGPNNGVLEGQQSAWQYTANAGFNGNDSARFTLSLGSGTALFNVLFAVTSAPAVTQPEVQVITTTLLPEIFQPPRIMVLSSQTPTFNPPVSIANIDALSEIVTASGPSFEQPLREFSASRLQCR